MRRLWGFGWFRLALLVLVVGAAWGAVALADRGSKPSAAERAAAERTRLARLHAEAVRLRKAGLRDPAVRRERARLREEQRPRFGSGRPGVRSRAAQTQLVRALERSITRDARARFKAGEFDKHVVDTQCEHLVRPVVQNPPLPRVGARGAGYEGTAAAGGLHTPRSPPGTATPGCPVWG